MADPEAPLDLIPIQEVARRLGWRDSRTAWKAVTEAGIKPVYLAGRRRGILRKDYVLLFQTA